MSYHPLPIPVLSQVRQDMKSLATASKLNSRVWDRVRDRLTKNLYKTIVQSIATLEKRFQITHESAMTCVHAGYCRLLHDQPWLLSACEIKDDAAFQFEIRKRILARAHNQLKQELDKRDTQTGTSLVEYKNETKDAYRDFEDDIIEQIEKSYQNAVPCSQDDWQSTQHFLQNMQQKWLPDAEWKVLQGLLNNMTVKDAAAQAGVSARTVHAWRVKWQRLASETGFYNLIYLFLVGDAAYYVSYTMLSSFFICAVVNTVIKHISGDL